MLRELQKVIWDVKTLEMEKKGKKFGRFRVWKNIMETSLFNGSTLKGSTLTALDELL
jgi:hypothetical protein